jgi:hypothetical protein
MGVSIQELKGQKEDPQTALNRLGKEYSLNERQKSYIHHFVINGGKRKEAALEAGYLRDKRHLIEDTTNKSDAAQKARATIGVTTTNIMKNPKIKQAIEEYEEIYKDRERSEVEGDVFRIAKLRANYDIREFADTLTGDSPEEVADKIRNLPEDLAVSVDSISFKYWGKDADKFSVDIKFADRQKSIDFLAKLTGLMVDKKEVKQTGGMPSVNITLLGDGNKDKERKVN